MDIQQIRKAAEEQLVAKAKARKRAAVKASFERSLVKPTLPKMDGRKGVEERVKATRQAKAELFGLNQPPEFQVRQLTSPSVFRENTRTAVVGRAKSVQMGGTKRIGKTRRDNENRRYDVEYRYATLAKDGRTVVIETAMATGLTLAEKKRLKGRNGGSWLHQSLERRLRPPTGQSKKGK